jgi:hypothetical protein
MTIRAKFFVRAIEFYSSPQDQAQVKLSACKDKEGDNVDWTKWTPCGELTMTVNNPTAVQQFKQWMQDNKRIYLDFNEVTD